MIYTKYELSMKKCKVHESKFDYCMSEPMDVIDFVVRILKMKNYAEERVIEIMTDCKGNVIGYTEISRGDLTGSVIHPREFFKPAILANAAAVIMVHNHPSGSSDPSKDDISTTKRLADCGKMLGVKLLDSIIVGDHCKSLLQEGLM